MGLGYLIIFQYHDYRRCPVKTSDLHGQFFVMQILELRHLIYFFEKSNNKVHTFVKALFLVFY